MNILMIFDNVSYTCQVAKELREQKEKEVHWARASAVFRRCATAPFDKPRHCMLQMVAAF